MLHEQLKIHKVFEKLDMLEKHADKYTWNDEHTKLYRTLDGVIIEAMKNAENTIGQSFSTIFEWSPTL